MTKRVVALILCLCMFFCGSSMTTVFAASGARTATIPVLFDNNDGVIVDIPVKIKGDFVYCNAEEMCSLITARFEHTNEEFIVYAHEIVIYFSNNSRNVSYHVMMGASREFSLPCKTFVDDTGYWVSFTSFLTLLNCPFIIDENYVRVGMPQETVFDVISRINNYITNGIYFDIVTDFGLEDEQWVAGVMAGSARLVSVLQGVLTGDENFASLRMLIGGITCDTSAYDQKYANAFIKVLATHRTQSVEEVSDRINSSVALIIEAGEVEDLASEENITMLGDIVDNWDTTLTRLQVDVTKGTASVEDCFAASKSLERAQNSQKFLKGLDAGTKVADILPYVVEAALVYSEFESRDQMTIDAIGTFLENKPKKQRFSNDSYVAAQTQYDMLSGNGASYISSNWVMSAVPEFLTEKAYEGLGLLTGNNVAELLTTAWSFASENCGSLKESLDMVDKFELACYAMSYEYDSYMALLEYCSKAKSTHFSDSEWQNARLLAYNCLKSCLVARDAGMASIQSEFDEKPNLKSQLESRQNYIESQLRILESADIGCTDDVFSGFLKNYNDSVLIGMCEIEEESTDDSNVGEVTSDAMFEDDQTITKIDLSTIDINSLSYAISLVAGDEINENTSDAYILSSYLLLPPWHSAADIDIPLEVFMYSEQPDPKDKMSEAYVYAKYSAHDIEMLMDTYFNRDYNAETMKYGEYLNYYDNGYFYICYEGFGDCILPEVNIIDAYDIEGDKIYVIYNYNMYDSTLYDGYCVLEAKTIGGKSIWSYHQFSSSPMLELDNFQTHNADNIEAYKTKLLDIHDNPYDYLSTSFSFDIEEYCLFGIADINEDGVDELIVDFIDGEMSSMHMRVWRYDGASGKAIELATLDEGCEFYSNNIVKSYATLNHSMGETIWPYTLYKWNQSQNSYVEFASAYCEDKAWTEDIFPSDKDADGDGVIYYLTIDGNESACTKKEYNAFVQKYISNEDKIDIVWHNITVNNISELT